MYPKGVQASAAGNLPLPPSMSRFHQRRFWAVLRRHIHIGIASKEKEVNLCVTTPIFYVNASPHVGHAYSMILADAIARWHRIRYGPRGHSSLFTGTDEHGQKVYAAAKANNSTPQAWTKVVSSHFRHLCDTLGVNVERFIRTTDPDHAEAVQTLWRRIYDAGDIYLGKHAGWYSLSDETFHREHELVRNGSGMTVKESGKKVVWVEEPNFIFRLSKYRDRIIEWLRSEDNIIVPRSRLNDLWDYLCDVDNFKDISVSRRVSSCQWGIRVPNDDTQMIYVWLDALTNYLTVTGFPNIVHTPEVHLIGKDILK